MLDPDPQQPSTSSEPQPLPSALPESPAKDSIPMLDVHPPHHAANTWRDFFVHIGTIAVGLLIAIGLEASIEWMHHRHLVAEARENIHREIAENQQLLPRNLESLQKDEAQLKENIATIRLLRDHPKDLRGKILYNLYWSGFTDAAWRTARDTGALSYMPYDEVQQFSQLYGQQQYLSGLGTTLFTEQSKAAGPIYAEGSIEQLTPPEIDRRMVNTTSLYVQVQSLQELLQQLKSEYTQALPGEPHPSH
jgi:hypothetical protein